VHLLPGRQAGARFELALDEGRAGRAADEHNAVEIPEKHARVGERLLNGVHGAFDERENLRLVVRARDLHREVQWHVVLFGDELLLDASKGGEGEAALGGLDRRAKTVKGPGNVAEIDVVLPGKSLDNVIEEKLIEVVTSEVRVAVTCFDFDDPVLDFDDGDIERTTA
jgi:hypothetical protein